MIGATGRDRAIFTDRRALVIDDNLFMRRLVRSLLRQFGFDVIDEAADGSQALMLIAEQSYDVVVCDWMMEPVDGYAFVRSLRHHPVVSVRNLPVVMLTAVAEQDKVAAARDAGVTEYLVKPVSSGKLRARLTAALTRPRPFVVADGYVGPDRRRRDDPSYSGTRRRLADRLLELEDEDPDAGPEWEAAAAHYPNVLRGEIERLRLALAAVEATDASSLEIWRPVHRIAHDLKGQAPTFGYLAVADIAGSLERLIRPAIAAPDTLARSTERRVRAAATHAEALSLILEQGIRGRSPEVEALAERLTRAVERVHRESLATP